MPVSIDSLTELGDVCNKVCFWLTHLVAQVNADGQGAALKSPPGVSEIFDLALKLPKVDAAQWAAIAKTKTGAALAPAAAGKEPGTRKRMQWTEELTRDLINIVDDDEYRTQHLGEPVQMARFDTLHCAKSGATCRVTVCQLVRGGHI
jgi:hypothetical protein